MPIVRRSNNRILPNNSRNVDVARKTIREVIDVQQQKYMNAFRVQGFQAALYTRLNSGIACTCQTTQKQLNTRLGEDGKAKPGFINELLSGANFSIENYGSSDITIQDLHDAQDFNMISHTESGHDGKFDVISAGDFASTQVIDGDSGANGPALDLDDMVGMLDPMMLGFNDVSCAVCFGTGFVGGYSVFNGVRITRDVTQVELTDNITYDRVPWVSKGDFSFTTRLPSGAVKVDSCGVFLDSTRVAATIFVDGEVATVDLLLSKCDGREHLIEARTESEFTHIEIQFATNTEPAYFEFPRMSKTFNADFFDETDPFSIHVGPNVPRLQVMDILKDSTYGKTMVVTSVNEWNTKNLNNLGHTCSVRVCQPQELFNILAKRGPVEHTQTTLMVRDNIKGHRT